MTTIKQYPTKKKIPVGAAITLDKNGYAIPVSTPTANIIGIVQSSANKSVQVIDPGIGVFTSSATYATTGSTWVTTGFDEEPKRTKQIFECSECGKKIAEFWGHGYSAWGDKVHCKTCHQIDKLKE
jgi:hypothetical protein